MSSVDECKTSSDWLRQADVTNPIYISPTSWEKGEDRTMYFLEVFNQKVCNWPTPIARHYLTSVKKLHSLFIYRHPLHKQAQITCNLDRKKKKKFHCLCFREPSTSTDTFSQVLSDTENLLLQCNLSPYKMNRLKSHCKELPAI